MRQESGRRRGAEPVLCNHADPLRHPEGVSPISPHLSPSLPASPEGVSARRACSTRCSGVSRTEPRPSARSPRGSAAAPTSGTCGRSGDGADSAPSHVTSGCTRLRESLGQVWPPMEQILNSPALAEPSLSRAAALLREHADSEEAAPWKIRLRTRDLLGVMNCVQCNLCRLHGKVTVAGFAAALQAPPPATRSTPRPPPGTPPFPHPPPPPHTSLAPPWLLPPPPPQVLLGYRGRGDHCDKEADPYSLNRVEARNPCPSPDPYPSTETRPPFPHPHSNSPGGCPRRHRGKARRRLPHRRDAAGPRGVILENRERPRSTHAHGGTRAPKRARSLQDQASFSFFPSFCVGCGRFVPKILFLAGEWGTSDFPHVQSPPPPCPGRAPARAASPPPPPPPPPLQTRRRPPASSTSPRTSSCASSLAATAPPTSARVAAVSLLFHASLAEDTEDIRLGSPPMCNVQ